MSEAIMRIKRVADNGKETFGVLIQNRVPFALTLEPPWNRNLPRESCIPAGVYNCKKVRSPKFGETYEIQDVPGRTLIRFHWGNTEADTLGCPLIGEEFGILNGNPAILSSMRGFSEFMQRLNGRDEFSLIIDDV